MYICELPWKPAQEGRSRSKQRANTTDSSERTVRNNPAMSAIVGAAPALPINPAEWSYLAEGGFHIILRYDGKDPELTGRILRIGKKALGHEEEKGGKKAAAPAVVAPDEAGARRKFERGVLMPLLGEQYVQPGDAVILSREDIEKIHHRCAGVGGFTEAVQRLRVHSSAAVL